MGDRSPKTKVILSNAIDKDEPSSRVSTRGALEKQAADFMIEFGSDLAKLDEIFNVFSKNVFE